MNQLAATAKSLLKIALLSRPVPSSRRCHGGSIIVMGNGPSLNDTIAAHLPLLKAATTMAVNFAALAPVFFDIKPRYYVMADPHFFSQGGDGGNLDLLREALRKVDWEMELFVPAKFRRKAARLYPSLKITPFNAVGLEGYRSFTSMAYRLGMGMPRPRNVLIPAIMLAIATGYTDISIVGADHSWMTSLSVTDENEVVSIQPHFYADSDHEQARVRHEYRGYRLHQIVESFAIAFRSYHHIADYAASRGVKIYNATPGSFIDAFPRRPLS